MRSSKNLRLRQTVEAAIRDPTATPPETHFGAATHRLGTTALDSGSASAQLVAMLGRELWQLW